MTYPTSTAVGRDAFRLESDVRPPCFFLEGCSGSENMEVLGPCYPHPVFVHVYEAGLVLVYISKGLFSPGLNHFLFRRGRNRFVYFMWYFC